MKLFVNGQECDLPESGCEIRRLSDRLTVHTPEGTFTSIAIRDGETVLVSYRGQQFSIERKRPRATAHGTASSGEIRAPMPGQIVDVIAGEGKMVSQGDKMLVLEAMKTQQAFSAPFDGVVAKIHVSKGDQVDEGAVLAIVKPAGES